MPFFAALFVASILALWGADRLGRRSPMAAIAVSFGLLGLAYAFFSVRASQGEGAAAGVGVVWFGSWYLGGVCLLVVLTLLGTAALRRDSLMAKLLLVFVVPIAAILLVHRFSPASSSDTAHTAPPKTESRATRTDGYVWAVDNGILADSSCHGGTQAFIAGCQAGAARNRVEARR